MLLPSKKLLFTIKNCFSGKNSHRALEPSNEDISFCERTCDPAKDVSFNSGCVCVWNFGKHVDNLGKIRSLNLSNMLKSKFFYLNMTKVDLYCNKRYDFLKH